MNWHAYQHLTQVLRRANSLRKELEDIAKLERNTPGFPSETHPHNPHEETANEIAELAKQQAEVIAGIEEVLYPPEKKSDVM
jgi:hypothetical protein